MNDTAAFDSLNQARSPARELDTAVLEPAANPLEECGRCVVVISIPRDIRTFTFTFGVHI